VSEQTPVLVTTTNSVEGRRIVAYKGLVGGDAILGANMFRDFFAGIRDILGGRSGSYEKVLRKAKTEAVNDMIEQARELGANAVVGVDLDYETVGGSMLMVSATGTAVKVAATDLLAFMTRVAGLVVPVRSPDQPLKV
jgi:uncharacterized protein YbjQ (UPF0145 family)